MVENNSKEEEYFVTHEMIWNSNVSLCKWSFIGTVTHPLTCTVSCCVFVLQQPRWGIVTKTRWPTKPHLCITAWPFVEVCWPESLSGFCWEGFRGSMIWLNIQTLSLRVAELRMEPPATTWVTAVVGFWNILETEPCCRCSHRLRNQDPIPALWLASCVTWGKLLNFSCATVSSSLQWDCLEDYVSFYSNSTCKSALHIAGTMLLLAMVISEIPWPFREKEKDAFLRAMGSMSAQPHSCLSGANSHACFRPAQTSASFPSNFPWVVDFFVPP